MSKHEKKKTYDTFCSICGFPLHLWQVSAIIDETTVMSYNDRQYVDFSAHICAECWDKIKTNNIGGMEKAEKQLKNLEKLQKKGNKLIT